DGPQLVLNSCDGHCSVDYEVTVPRGTTVVGTATSGNIKLTNTGAVDVRTTSGNVDVDLSNPADVHAKATSGNIEVTVPNKGYRIQGGTSGGDRKIDISDDPAATHVLDLTTTGGDVEV